MDLDHLGPGAFFSSRLFGGNSSGADGCFLISLPPPVEKNTNQCVNSGGKEFKTPGQRNVDTENNIN